MTAKKRALREGSGPRAHRRRGRPRLDEYSPLPARKRIMEEAIREFAATGFDGASIAGIAVRAGVDQALIYYHFKDKLSLWKQSVANGFDSFRSHFADLAPEIQGLDPATMIRFVGRRYAHYMVKHPYVARLLLMEMTQISERTHWLIREEMMPTYDIFKRIIRSAQNDGVIRNDLSADNIVNLMNGAGLFFILSQRLMAQLNNESTTWDVAEDEMNHLSDIVSDFIFWGLGGPNAPQAPRDSRQLPSIQDGPGT